MITYICTPTASVSCHLDHPAHLVLCGEDCRHVMLRKTICAVCYPAGWQAWIPLALLLERHEPGKCLDPSRPCGARSGEHFCECVQERVKALTDAHYVDSSAFGIPRAEQDAAGELLLGKCRQCDATRLLSSLAEHEATCRPDQAPSRQAPAAASLPAAAEGAPSTSQVQRIACRLQDLHTGVLGWCDGLLGGVPSLSPLCLSSSQACYLAGTSTLAWAGIAALCAGCHVHCRAVHVDCSRDSVRHGFKSTVGTKAVACCIGQPRAKEEDHTEEQSGPSSEAPQGRVSASRRRYGSAWQPAG